MIVYKPNGEKANVTSKAYETIYKYKGFTLQPKEMTKSEIIKELEHKDIAHNKKSNKAELLALLSE